MHLFQSIALSRLGDTPLIRLTNAIDWERVATILDDEAKRARQRKGGREPYNHVAMFRALLLGEWFGLSYQKLAEALRARLDFILFCGFDAFADLPDASTLNRLALRLADGAGDKARAEVSDQLSKAGIELVPTFEAIRNPRIRFGKCCRWRSNVKSGCE